MSAGSPEPETPGGSAPGAARPPQPETAAGAGSGATPTRDRSSQRREGEVGGAGDAFGREGALVAASPPGAASRALDRLFAAYLVAAGAAFLFPNRPAVWPLLAGLHAVGIALILRPSLVRAATEPAARRWPRLLLLLRAGYPLALIPLLYAELALLNRSVHGGRYFDALVISWEAALFGGQPSQTFAEAAPWLLLSEALHAGYLSYYLIIYGPPLLLFAARRYRDFEYVLFLLMLTFFVHYLFFIYFPVQGPRYLFPTPGTGEGPLLRLTHAILEGGSSRGAAFPSSHVAVAVVQTVLAARLLPRLFPVLALATVALALGTVYGGFHYAVDAVAGLALGLAMFALGGLIRRALLPSSRRIRSARPVPLARPR